MRPATLFAFAFVAACGSSSDTVPADDPNAGGDGGKLDAARAADGAASVGDDGSTTEPDGALLPDGAAEDDGGMATWKPTAKGLWIWYFDYVGMSASDAADKAKAAGVGYVLIKSGQDANFWTTRYTAQAVQEFTSRGMRVFAWPYFTPNDVAGSIDAAASAANTPGTSGLVLDVEIEWESGDHSADAQQLCQGIRAKVPGVWLGYTSFGWVGLHTNFPFQAFDTYCGDSAWPQVYYSDRGVSWDNPTKGLAGATAQYKAAGLRAPMWPIQSNDDVYNTSAGPTIANLNAYFDAAGPYSSLWEFPEAARSDKLDQLPSLHWTNP